MRAAVYTAYGDTSVIQLQDIPTPKYKDNEVLVKVRAVGVNPIDWKVRKGMLRYIMPIKFPAIGGLDICGDIVAIGKQVTKYRVGDCIFTRSDRFPGGGYAEYAVLREDTVAPKPDQLSPVEASSIPLTALTALQALRDKGHIQQNDEVLIIGASGGVGLFAVQLAKFFGAKVTAVCSTKNVEWVQSLGPDEVIDYKVSPIFKSNQSFNIIFDTVVVSNYVAAKPYLKNQGTYITTLPDLNFLFGSILSLFSSKKAKFILEHNSLPDLMLLRDLVNQGKLKTRIDSTYELTDLAKAHERSETHHASGKIVIKVAD